MKNRASAEPRSAFSEGNISVTFVLSEYLTADGKSPFGEWFLRQEATAAAKVTVQLYRMEQGNLSNVAPVGAGVSEKKMDWGPGYRIYFALPERPCLLLLGGSVKADQHAAIKTVKLHWQDYKRRRSSRPWH
ncbi:MAG: type II toxin-antitoxin system RelE/ParE family toxin [Pseudomonadota bacterium]